MNSFAAEISASLPSGITLPSEFVATFNWLELNNFVQRSRTGQRYASLFPAGVTHRSCIGFLAVDPGHAKSWCDPPDAAARLAPFIRTGGDGSYAGLWVDDQGRQHFVHMGSGSGSTLACVLTNNPVDMLRFLAIGYDEACWPEHFKLTAKQTWALNETGDDSVLPSAFQQFVATTFGVTIPDRASQIVKRTAKMDDVNSDDPFCRWIRSCDT